MERYHAYSLSYPNTFPFDRSDLRWPTFVGEFILPITQQHPNLLYWSSDYGETVEFKAYTDDSSLFRPHLDALQQLGFRITELNRCLEEDLGGGRFRSPTSLSTPTERAILILKSLKSVCDLVVDSVFKQTNGYWSSEVNIDTLQNPTETHFFSITHLYHHITKADCVICPHLVNDQLALLGYIDYQNGRAVSPHQLLGEVRVIL